MTSIKVKFRASTTESKEGSILYQFIHERKVKVVTTDYHIFPSEWDDKRESLKVGDDRSREKLLAGIRQRIRWDMERINKIVKNLEAKTMQFTVIDIVNEYQRQTRESSVFGFMERQIAKLKQNGKTRTAETYSTTLNSFKAFRNKEDIQFDGITDELMQSYEAWLKERGLRQNTTSFYMRILRAVYNLAVEEEIVEPKQPFRHVYTGIDKTVKRAVPLKIIKKIKALDLSLQPDLDYARDIFMLSFALRGMSFIDMAFLKKSDLRNGVITYRRHKTGQTLTIEWTKEMQEIVFKHPENTTSFLLPIIYNEEANLRNSYKYAGTKINGNLKKVAEMVGLDMPLTLYCARHSWASAAREKGVPLSVISEGMGHDSEATTQIYLASLDSSSVDKANSMLLKYIF